MSLVLSSFSASVSTPTLSTSHRPRHVLSSQTLNSVASQGPSSSGTSLVLESSPGVTVGGSGACRARLRGDTTGRQVAKSRSPVAIEMGESTGAD
jgi:hypothetical protein